MPRRLIATVGTSLLTNREERPWGGWNVRDGRPLPDAAVVDAWLEKADPVKACAESNTLSALDVGGPDRVALLCSGTAEGRFCAARLARYYEAVVPCAEAAVREIEALGYQQDKFVQRGLRHFVDLAIAEVRKARAAAEEPVFCATGGFKAEIAFLNLLGALLGVEVYYLHEMFRKIVCLPRLPLAWDIDQVLRHEDFFTWIDSEPRRSGEVASWLRANPELRPLVEEDADGHAYLNAAGNMLYQAARERRDSGPRATWPPDADRLPREKDGISVIDHHRPHGWERLVKRLCDADCVSRVAYDDAAYGGPAVKVLDADHGVIAVRYAVDNLALPLRVDTTASGEAQCELVAGWIRRTMRR
ncbi:MAG: putative CRISPR-associated protein [Candidatus Schekmanbacteria bacterium]|nr:putative CRISPR-associated protein [Candidatus Schekmanbacteria bacterium]